MVLRCDRDEPIWPWFVHESGWCARAAASSPFIRLCESRNRDFSVPVLFSSLPAQPIFRGMWTSLLRVATGVLVFARNLEEFGRVDRELQQARELRDRASSLVVHAILLNSSSGQTFDKELVAFGIARLIKTIAAPSTSA
jgi:hypothetical protein